MRLRFPFLLFIVFFVATAAALPAKAERLCFCRLTDHSALTTPDEKKFCRNETVILGTVDSTLLLAIPSCRDTCTTAGQEFVGVSKDGDDDPGQLAYDTALVQDTYCVFSKDAHGPSDANPITGWNDTYNDCRSPINSIPNVYNREGALPNTCSFCFCKYKSNVTPSNCADKTVYMHATGAPEMCPRFCEDMGMESAGSAMSNYNDLCDFKSNENCEKSHSTGGKCGEILGETNRDLAFNASQANRGSALGQLIPLGDISLPQVIGRLIRQLLSVVGAIALVFFIWGGIKYMTAAGDEKKVMAARNMLVTTVSALLAIFLSYALLSLLINVLN